MKTIISFLFACGVLLAQSSYELTPGAKNNTLKITFANISPQALKKLNLMAVILPAEFMCTGLLHLPVKKIIRL
jgi:hypothetical protein